MARQRLGGSSADENASDTVTEQRDGSRVGRPIDERKRQTPGRTSPTMEAGALEIDDLSGGLNLRATLESGQSYCWRREDGRMYEENTSVKGDSDPAALDDGWYYTVLPGRNTALGNPEVLRARQRDGLLEWEASTPAGADHLQRLLRLDDDLVEIRGATPDEPLLRRAFAAYDGMRLVRDPPFRTLISFICSAQMHVSRIHNMQVALARAYGETLTVDGRSYHAFPTPTQLSQATEAELRELKLGYRAPYVCQTAEMVASGDRPEDARGLPYEAAREHLTRFVGVGRKVADCVLLFSLDYLEAVPLDTWIRRTIAEYYPDCNRGSYAATSRAIRDRFGGEYAGYVQTYVFHYLRSGGEL